MKRLFIVSCFVPFAALLFAGCGEDPVTSPERTLLNDQTTYTPVETIQVPATGETTTSTNALQSGVLYRIRVTGTVNTGNGMQADAEFTDFSTVPTSSASCDSSDSSGAAVDVGLSINDATVDNQKSPNWGAFSNTHTYTYDIIGTGQPLSFDFHDCDYSDNSGSLTVLISRATETPLPSGNFQTVETLQVPANCDSTTSSTVLQSGVTYQLRVSGTVNTGNGVMADAEFANFSNVPSSLVNTCDSTGTDSTATDIGLIVNGSQLGQTDWGTFRTNHTYVTTIQGTGQPLSFSFHDCDCSDNSGFLAVEIRAPRTQGGGGGGNGQGPRLDVRPGNSRNFVNPRSHGMLTVAVLGVEGFDVNSVTVSGLGLSAEGSSNAAKPMHTRVQDVNHDGIPDLVLQFKIDQLNIQEGDSELCLSGLVVDGQSTQVCDSITTVGGFNSAN